MGRAFGPGEPGIVSSRGLEGAADPRGRSRGTVEGKDIEAAGRFRAQPRKKVSGGGDDAPLLAGVDAGGGPAPRRPRAQPNLQEDEHRPLAGDDVHLPEPRAVVAREDGEPLRREEAGGELLRRLAAKAGADAGRGAHCAGASGTARPESKPAGTSARVKCRSASRATRPVTPSSEKDFRSACSRSELSR